MRLGSKRYRGGLRRRIVLLLGARNDVGRAEGVAGVAHGG